MPCEQQRHTLILVGMHLRSRRMVQCNGSPNRFWELVRIFTDSWWWKGEDRHCTKFVGEDMIERVIRGSHHTSTGICTVKAFKESHEKALERLAADRRTEVESKEAQALANDPKHTVISMTDLTSPVRTHPTTHNDFHGLGYRPVSLETFNHKWNKPD